MQTPSKSDIALMDGFLKLSMEYGKSPDFRECHIRFKCDVTDFHGIIEFIIIFSKEEMEIIKSPGRDFLTGRTTQVFIDGGGFKEYFGKRDAKQNLSHRNEQFKLIRSWWWVFTTVLLTLIVLLEILLNKTIIQILKSITEWIEFVS